MDVGELEFSISFYLFQYRKFMQVQDSSQLKRPRVGMLCINIISIHARDMLQLSIHSKIDSHVMD